MATVSKELTQRFMDQYVWGKLEMTDKQRIAALRKALKLAMEYWRSWEEGFDEERGKSCSLDVPGHHGNDDWLRCQQALKNSSS